MATKWTKAQQEAIELKNRNLLVAAAAGSGKTAVLVERIITKISRKDNPLDIDKLLVVTFTRAAAVEMKERIGNRLSKLLEENPSNTHLRKQYTLLSHASITTIDSFCLRIVRDYFNELDMDPDFRIGEEGELKLLEADVMSAFLEDCYEQGEENFLEFVESYGTGKSDGGLEDYILQVYRFAQAAPYPQKWLEGAGEYLQAENLEELENQAWVKNILFDFHLQANELKELSNQAINLCRQEDGPAHYLAMIESDTVFVDRILNADTFMEIYQILKELKFVRKPVKKNAEVSEEKKEAVSALRDQLKASLKEMQKQYSTMEETDILEGIKNIRLPMLILLSMVKEYSLRFSAAKREKNILDFSDIEHLALQILLDAEGKPTRAANELKEQFEEILIDEYQDSNYLQEAILDGISRRRDGSPNTFMVGDVKQSIYRFRMARPELFLEKYGKYSKEESLFQKIDLHQNFRSRAEILEGINFIFRQVMTMQMGNVYYDDDAALHSGAAYPDTVKEEAAIELLLVDASKENLGKLDLDADSNAQNVQQLEGALIARKIKELTNPQTGMDIYDKDKGQMRKANYRDIVVLLRSFSGWSQDILQVLLKEQIPAYAQSSTGYFDALEVQTVLNLLKVIDNPRQDIPLASVLKSPFVGLTSVELAKVVAFYKENTKRTRQKGLYPAISFYLAQGDEAEIKNLLLKGKEQILRYRKEAIVYPVHELLYHIFTDTGYYDYVSSLPAGVVRQANLEMLVQKAISYASTSYHGLFHFVRYIENLQKYEVDYAPAATASEQDDLVRITSIHKSKGLEYPIVIVAGMGKMMNKQDSRAKILLHPDLGISADFIDAKKRLRIPTLCAKAFSRRILIDNSSEELRILYVALTRSKEKLILTAADSHLKSRMKKWKNAKSCVQETLPFTLTSKALGYLDWVLMALEREHPKMIAVKEISLEQVLGSEVAEEISFMEKEKALEELDIKQIYSKEMNERIKQYLQWEYPYLEDLKLHSKFTVSEIKRMYARDALEGGINLLEEKVTEQKEEATLPAFMREEQKISRSTRGTLYHRVLELMDESKTYHTKVMEEELKEKIAKGQLDKNALNEVNLWEIYEFYQSDLGKRVIKAKEEHRLHKEQAFIMTLPASKIKLEWKSKEEILIQGIIDLWFEEGGEIVLVDYKTDRVKDEQTLINRYHGQFDFYQKALEQLTKKKVKETYLYSFGLKKAIKL